MKIEYKDVHVRLGGNEILKGTEICSHEGKIVGIIGANGCGKSTLIKTTFGLVPFHQGDVTVDGKSVRDISPRELASMIGYVGQDSACAFDFSVSDVVAMGLYARRVKPSNSREIIQDALRELGIEEYADRSILSLSGGERKLAFIARAVAQGSGMFILDEPTNHLDIRHQLFLMDYLKACGKTTLIVIHDLRLAAHYCDYLYMMTDGKVYAQGDPLTALTLENVKAVFGIEGYAYNDMNDIMDFSLFTKEAVKKLP